ncbi:SBBP repeat-containing protein [Phenylobacterium soli]|uniref:Regulatory protein FlaEY n=1 Tax=Phenylobacterium soli TaxID=2170551 RepID=A0A328AMP7_9CAUL|nr:SBBP repeat-containing protein [Phenylobacterium soli]RAK55615.1 hypothetical protein DJ017_14405 [Phenylobacterium soli]
MTVTFDTSVLVNWYQAKAGFASAAATAAGGSGASGKVPTAPWNPGVKQPKTSALVSAALSGKSFIDEKAAKLDVPNASADYKKLFAINQGLVTLQALANAANDSKTPAYQLTQIQAAFDRGMNELSKYVQGTKFANFRLTEGVVNTAAVSAAGVGVASDSYTTAPLVSGSADTVVSAFQGTVQFSADVTNPSTGNTTTVNFDLSEMGATPRTMTNVTLYMNDKLKTAGVGIRVQLDRTDSAAETATVNGKTVTISASQPQFGFKFTGLANEKLAFSAPTTAPSVFIAQTAGNPDPDGKATTNDGVTQQELLKLETGSGADAARRPGDENYVSGRVFSEKLPDGVTAVHATATGADGSVYMLADATGTVSGQPIKGAQDAVLLKYDSAGKLIYTQTLGAGVSASGASLAVSADGKVAIAGAITGELDSGDAGADAKTSDSFVTVFDAQGQEMWSDRQGATGADQAQAVAFDASGRVYVAGKTQGSIGGGTPSGGWDGYLRAYDTTGAVLSTRQFGTAGDDSVAGIVVNGTDVLVAGQDGGSGMVRRFDATDPRQMSLAATRNLGALGGGSVSGIGLDGAGNVLIGGTTGADLGVGTTTLARGGGLDGFGVKLSADLTAGAGDAVAYYGGGGADKVTAVTVANGQLWLTGTATAALPSLSAIGKQDGFVAALDVGAGAVIYSQRFTAKDEMDAPEAIAVDTGGGSALDRLGLPKGTIQYGGSDLLTAATSLRAGDQFQIRQGSSPTPVTITIAANETLDSLTKKIQSAGLFGVVATTVTDANHTTLSLKPATDRQSFELLPGPDGRDALQSLGIKPGLIRKVVIDKKKGVLPADKGSQTYGLHITSNLDLSSKADIKSAIDGINNAITTVRAIYVDLKQAAQPKSATASGSGTVPAYLKSQIADYQAALARLSASSSSSSSSSGSSLASLFG